MRGSREEEIGGEIQRESPRGMRGFLSGTGLADLIKLPCQATHKMVQSQAGKMSNKDLLVIYLSCLPIRKRSSANGYMGAREAG